MPGRLKSGLPAALVLLGLAGTTLAQSPDVMRVEEDWELVLGEPADQKDSPQLTTAMSPYPNLGSYHVLTAWNFIDYPEFASGGIQVQAWDGDTCTHGQDHETASFATTSETIRWTQFMRSWGPMLKYQIRNGSSVTWGAFGGNETALLATGEADTLNAYDTAVSVQNSGISFGGNRVQLLRITQVRRYDANGNILSTDNVPKIVFQQQSTN